MWKLTYCKYFIFLLFLTACQQELKIEPADDLNRFYHYPESRIFTVKTSWFQEIQCSDLEKWAQNNLTTFSKKDEVEYRFIEYHDDITLKGNKFLEKEYDILTLDYTKCRMKAYDKKCYSCKKE